MRAGDKQVLTGLSLEVAAGEVHAIMGPNGSGKSTLVQVLAGREGYEVTAGSAHYQGRDLLALPPEERAREGVFLAFQYPVEIPGVNNVYLLKAGLNAVRKHRGLPELDAFEFLALVRDKMKLMHMDESFLNRGVNEGFSGGEKKRNEILQMAVLEPTLALLDETDSGSTSTRCAWSRTASTACDARIAPSSWSRTTSGCSTTSSPTVCMSFPAAASSRAATNRSHWSWRSAATTGSGRRRRSHERRPAAGIAFVRRTLPRRFRRALAHGRCAQRSAHGVAARRAGTLRSSRIPDAAAGRLEVHEPAPARNAHVRAGRECRRGARRA